MISPPSALHEYKIIYNIKIIYTCIYVCIYYKDEGPRTRCSIRLSWCSLRASSERRRRVGMAHTSASCNGRRNFNRNGKEDDCTIKHIKDKRRGGEGEGEGGGLCQTHDTTPFRFLSLSKSSILHIRPYVSLSKPCFNLSIFNLPLYLLWCLP